MNNDLPALLRRAARALRIAAEYNRLHDDEQAEFAAPWQALAADLEAAAAQEPAAAPALLTLQEAAAYLRRGTSTVRRYVDEGSLRAHRAGGTARMTFRRDDLDALLQPVEPQRLASPNATPRNARAHAVAEEPAGYTTDPNEEQQ